MSRLHSAGDLRQAIREGFGQLLRRVAADELALRFSLWNGKLNNLVVSVAAARSLSVDSQIADRPLGQRLPTRRHDVTYFRNPWDVVLVICDREHQWRFR